MKLSELKKNIDFLLETGHEENEVRITLSQPSIGGWASVGIKGAFPGFDFESEQVQIRIEPIEPVCSRGRSKDDAMKMNIFAFSGPRKFYLCPMCGGRVKKDNCYCPRCGQHLTFDAEKQPSDIWKADIKDLVQASTRYFS